MKLFILLYCMILLFNRKVVTKKKHTYYNIEQKNGEKHVALTFDDGPHAILTPKLLDILKAKGAKATFFVMGIKAVVHPKILQRAYLEGHEIANHVWDHPVISKLTREKLAWQLDKTNQAIQMALNVTPAIMRPPYGNSPAKLNQWMADSMNLTAIMWSYDTNDWKRPKPEKIYEGVDKNIKPGTVLLCHDIHPSTIAAMPKLLEQNIKKGYKFLTVSEMIANAKG
jgi:peptidoglycan-N-acetylglucosamine deacetylase